MKIKSLLICTLFLTSIISGIATAKNPERINTSIAPSPSELGGDPGLIKITTMETISNLDNDYVVYAEGSTLYIYNLKTGVTDHVAVGGNIVYPKVSEQRVIYYDFSYMGFKMYDITTGEKTDLIVTNWLGGDADDYQFDGDYIVFQNYDVDIYATEIFLYTISTGGTIQLTDTPGEAFPENPCIYHNIIAWQLSLGKPDIFMYNIDSQQGKQITNTSQFEWDTYPSIYVNNVVYSYLYFDKVNGTRIYGLKMYNITTGEETTIFTGGEPTGGSPEIFGDFIVYNELNGRLNLYNLSTNYVTLIYESSYLAQPWDLNAYYVVFTVLGEGVYLFKYNNPPALEITIKGGLGVSAVLTNIGTENLTNITWSITLDGNMIFLGKTKSNTIPSIPAGKSVTVRDFVLGFGKTGILITAGSTTANATGTVFLFFIFGVK